MKQYEITDDILKEISDVIDESIYRVAEAYGISALDISGITVARLMLINHACGTSADFIKLCAHAAKLGIKFEEGDYEEEDEGPKTIH